MKWKTLSCVLSKRSLVCRQNDHVSYDTGVLTAHTRASRADLILISLLIFISLFSSVSLFSPLSLSLHNSLISNLSLLLSLCLFTTLFSQNSLLFSLMTMTMITRTVSSLYSQLCLGMGLGPFPVWRCMCKPRTTWNEVCLCCCVLLCVALCCWSCVKSCRVVSCLLCWR